MKLWQLFLLCVCISCDQHGEQKPTSAASDKTTEQHKEVSVAKQDSTLTQKTYANQRFKDVRVKQVAPGKFQVTGKAQVFEAAFSWVVEDGHEELLSGHTMTDAGAPEFGNFSFVLEAKKKNSNSTLHLILFEASPKDGSRQYELPVLLY